MLAYKGLTPYFIMKGLIMDTRIEVLFIIFIALLFVVLIATASMFLNYRRNLKRGLTAIKEVENIREQLESISEKHTSLQTTYDRLYEQYKELEKSKDRLLTVAYTDELTGIPNKSFIIEQIESIYSTLRKDEKFALFHIDVDNFKDITNRIGYSYGDELILDISHRLMEALETNDIVAREMSDEFLVLIQNIENVDDVDEKIKKIFKVFSYPFTIDSTEISVSVSIGITLAPEYAKTTTMLLDNTKLAMIEAKALGKNTHHYYSQQIGEKLSNDVLVQSKLQKAILNDEIEMYCQPVFSLNEEIISYEALARWKHPNEGLLMPESFMEVANNSGLIGDIDEIMLRKICQLQKNMDNQGKKNIIYSINTSFRQLMNYGTLDKLYEVVESFYADPTRIMLEIKENDLDISKYKELIDKISEIGFKICIDDFGKNSASINEISAIPIYMVKLDKNIIVDAEFEENARGMLASIIDVCNNLKIICIIKGIEFEEQKQYVQSLSCDGFQGFALEKPRKIL